MKGSKIIGVVAGAALVAGGVQTVRHMASDDTADIQSVAATDADVQIAAPIEVTDETIGDLLNEIYANQGKLSPEAQEKLDKMIQAAPDNYWLNVIKEKAK